MDGRDRTDNGYDISDYQDIDPMFGAMEDIYRRGFRNETSFFVCTFNERKNSVLVETTKAQYLAKIC